PWIPLGCLSILDGDPGLGKSTLTLDLAARVSRGWAMPPLAGGELVGHPRGVLLLTAEDDPARTVRPRLDAAGADAERIHFLAAVRTPGEDRPPVLPSDLDALQEAIQQYAVALVVVDPF